MNRESSPPSSESLVDAHQHAWDQSQFRYPWMAGRAELAVRALPRTHEDVGAILVEAGAAPSDRGREIAWLTDLAEAHPHILGVVAAADWRSIESTRLDELSANPRVVGVRLTLSGDLDRRASAPALGSALAAAYTHGLVVDILCPASQLPLLRQALEIEPNARIVLDHLGGPPWGQTLSDRSFRLWRDQLSHLADSPQLHAKLSGCPAPIVAGEGSATAAIVEAVQAFGPDRLMFGSDWPVSDNSDSLIRGQRWLEIIRGQLAGSHHAAVERDTAVMVYLSRRAGSVSPS